jgi:2-polyprenyl-6-methoxyphenol hydroxylase-like FAD-dependent oxidoreductase
MPPRTAIVVGAGIGGLAAALGLARAGVETVVVERESELREAGAGLSLWSNAIHALDVLGVADAIRGFSIPSVDAGLRRWDGRMLVTAAPAMLRNAAGDLCLVMHRADLQRALAEAVGPARIEFGRRSVGIRQDASGVTAIFADGGERRADLLVGADGLRSVVRGALHGAVPPRYAGYTAWRAVVAFDHRRLRPGESWGRGRRFGQIPIHGGLVYWFATRNAPEGSTSHVGARAELATLFRGWHAPIAELIDATDEAAILVNDIHDRPPLAHWGEGRVTLVGDAAHPMTPNLGQGACQAIEDAVVLSRMLERAPEVRPALRAYEAARIPRVHPIVKGSNLAGRIGQWSNPAAVWLRDGLMQLVGGRLQARQLSSLIRYEV